MPKIYAKGDAEIHAFIARVMEDWEPELAEIGVRVEALWVEADEGEPAILHHGYPAEARIKVNPLKQRLQGMADATVEIDRRSWVALTEARRVARMHHEIHHLEPVLDEDGQARLDDAARPKLRCRCHDLEIGIFDAVASAHGENADDTLALRAASDRLTQRVFLFSEAV